MEVRNIKVLRGPNYWSNYRSKLIVVKLDLLEYENIPSNHILGFPDNLKKLIPSLSQHRCSYGTEGGFFNRLDRGTWLGHVIEHTALELQWLAGMNCGFGRTRATSEKGVYHIVFSYEVENAGLYAAKAAIRIIETLASRKPYKSLEKDIETLREIYESEKLGPTTKSIVSEAEKRDIPYTRLDNNSLIMLGQGSHQKLICSSMSCLTSSIAVDMVADKENTKAILAEGLIPIPKGVVIHSIAELDNAIKQLGFPLVIKPLKGNHGRGITTNITSKEKAVFGFENARNFSTDIILEKYINGFDYRFLVINFKLTAVAKRTPAMIVGTGDLSVQQLIEEINKDPHRGEGHQNILTKIKVDNITHSILSDKGLTLESILPKGEILYLKDAANMSSGGTAVDVTNLVHPSNIFLAERTARLVNLDICGIDIVAEDISVPITEKNGAVIEVNASPGFRMHLAPSSGMKHNVAKPVLDMLYPQGKKARIPLVAITGTNGKTTIARLISYFAKRAGYSVGLSTTEALYIDNFEIKKGDSHKPLNAQTILRDPIVNFAVVECSRETILRSGLDFDQCNISIITNISEDHLGLDDIDSIQELARVKSVVARSTSREGYAILNADDDMVYEISKEVICDVALFSMSKLNKRVERHCAKGGLAAYIEDEQIVIQKANQKMYVAKLLNIPLTLLGKASCMIQNILPALLTGFICDFKVLDMVQWLSTFYPTPENMPGRMNLFDFNNIKVLVDHAHNIGAYIELKKFISETGCKKKVGIISAATDWPPIDISKVSLYSAQMFDEIIVRNNSASQTNNQGITDLLVESIRHFNAKTKVTVIPNEFEAIQYAINNATPNTFIVYFPDEIATAVNYLQQAELKLNSSTGPHVSA